MRFRWVTITIFLLMEQLPLFSCQSHANIYEDLLKNCSHFNLNVYTPKCPIGNYVHIENRTNCERLEITISVEFLRFLYIDGAIESFAATAQLSATWFVPCPMFDIGSEDMTIPIDRSRFWVPDLMHMNAIEDFAMESKYRRFFATKRDIFTDESVIGFYWQEIGLFNSYCNLAFDLFPFDRQECFIEIMLKGNLKTGSLNAVKNANVITNISDSYIPTEIVPIGSEWSLIGVTIREGVKEIYGNKQAIAIFGLQLERKSDYYVFNLIIPVFLLNFLSLTSFAIEASDPNRLINSLTLLLSLTVIQTDIRQRVPPVPQRNLLSNYADLSILHIWLSIIYFSIMTLSSRKKTWWINRKFKQIEMFAVVLFACQILAINLYLIIMSHAN